MDATQIKPAHPLIGRLAELLTSTWGEYLALEPYALPEDLGFVEGQLEGERLSIVNRCYQTRVFRKLHLELASVGPNLDILHCVMFPHAEYDLPILGTDIVASPQQVSAAIVDLSPVGERLPEHYLDGLAAAYARRSGFSQLRDLPAWGTIFSERCVFARITNPEEAELFLDISRTYLRLHCEAARNARQAGEAERKRILAGHQRYSAQQRQNDKTRRILEKAFGDAWAERYMTTVLFDEPGTLT